MPREPFDPNLTADQRQEFGLWLAYELQMALDAKASQDLEVDYWHQLYEQARTRLAKTTPWPDAADLTSYLACEKVDALHARLMQTIWVEPMWSVEGWGQSATQAPFVEEFHQWKAEEEGLQSVLDKLSLISLIEPRGLVEIVEDTRRRRRRKRLMAAIEMAPDPETGQMQPVFDGQSGEPRFERTDAGDLVEAEEGQPAAELTVDVEEPVRVGPSYRIIPYRHSAILPGHARDKSEIWGYGKQFTRRLAEIRAQASRGVYDRAVVDQLTTGVEVEPDKALERARMSVAPQDDDQAEKVLWELLVLVDLTHVIRTGRIPADAKGERWYVATLHLGQQLLLRVQYDDLGQSRYVPVILFPRPDRATEGFSLIGHKLITTVEEHTAWRNMIADRASLAVQAPLQRRQGALWEPDLQPWGPKQVIDVREIDQDVKAFQVPDVPQSAFERERAMERTAERLVGVNDIASGQFVEESKTLGEIRMATQQSFVRMDLVIRRFQEALEEIGQIRHAIWQRVLREQPEGLEAPSGVRLGLEARGQPLPNGRFSVAQLQGTWRFKPRGSVDTADPRTMRSDFTQFLSVLPAILQVFPMLQPMFQTPEAAKAMADTFIRLFRVPNRQAFLGGMQMVGQAGASPGAMMPSAMPGARAPGPRASLMPRRTLSPVPQDETDLA